MTAPTPRPTGRPGGRARQALHPFAALGFALFIAGLVAWLWLGDWRWALTGAAFLLISAAIAGSGPHTSARCFTGGRGSRQRDRRGAARRVRVPAAERPVRRREAGT